MKKTAAKLAKKAGSAAKKYRGPNRRSINVSEDYDRAYYAKNPPTKFGPARMIARKGRYVFPGSKNIAKAKILYRGVERRRKTWMVTDKSGRRHRQHTHEIHAIKSR